MTLKSSFLVTLLLPAFKLPVVGHKIGSHIAVDANGNVPKSDYFMMHESFSNSIPCDCLP
jgi:hypothetical protein